MLDKACWSTSACSLRRGAKLISATGNGELPLFLSLSLSLSLPRVIQHTPNIPSCTEGSGIKVSMHLGRRGIHFEIKSQRTLREPRSVSQIQRENPLFVTRTITHRSTRRPAEIRARSRRATSADGKYLAPIRLSIFPRVSCFPPPSSFSRR